RIGDPCRGNCRSNARLPHSLISQPARPVTQSGWATDLWRVVMRAIVLEESRWTGSDDRRQIGQCDTGSGEDSLDDRRTHHRPGQATLTDLGLVLDRPADEVIE